MSYSIRLEEIAESEYKSVTFKGTRVNNILGNKAAIPLLNSIFLSLAIMKDYQCYYIRAIYHRKCRITCSFILIIID